MLGFYSSIIFLGIVIVVAALVAIIFDKKRASNDEVRIDEKKNELVEIINDADQVLTELNNFSEYVVEQVDVKNTELNDNIKKAEEKIKELHSGYMEIITASDLNLKKVVNGSNKIQSIKIEKQQTVMMKEEKSGNSKKDGNTNLVEMDDLHKQKVIPINNKYNQVIEMSKKGVSKTEIAKIIGIGIGEIDLILDIRK